MEAFIREQERQMRRDVIRWTGWTLFYGAVVFMLLALR